MLRALYLRERLTLPSLLNLTRRFPISCGGRLHDLSSRGADDTQVLTTPVTARSDQLPSGPVSCGRGSGSHVPQQDLSFLELDYPFEVFPAPSVNLGIVLLYRQRWRPLGLQPGEVVRTVPLGPGQTEKVSTKVTRRTKTTRATESFRGDRDQHRDVGHDEGLQ